MKALLVLLMIPVIVALEAAWALTRPRLPARPGFEISTTVGSDRPGEPLRLHVIGDSTVAGVGVRDPEDSLPVQVARQASKQLDRPVSVVGHGVTGARTKDAIDQLDDVPSSGVDAIVIEVGSNDVTHATSLEDVETHTRALLLAARERSGIVVLGSAGKLNSPIFLPPLRWLVVARATAVRRRQEAVADDLAVSFMDVARDVSPAYDRLAPMRTARTDSIPRREAMRYGRGHSRDGSSTRRADPAACIPAMPLPSAPIDGWTWMGR